MVAGGVRAAKTRKEGFDLIGESHEMVVITNVRQNHKCFVHPGWF